MRVTNVKTGMTLCLKVNQVKLISPKTGLTEVVNGFYLFAPTDVQRTSLKTILRNVDGRTISVDNAQEVILLDPGSSYRGVSKSETVNGRSID